MVWKKDNFRPPCHQFHTVRYINKPIVFICWHILTVFIPNNRVSDDYTEVRNLISVIQVLWCLILVMMINHRN